MIGMIGMNNDDSVDTLSKERKRFQLLDEQYTVILSHHLQSSREPSHISNPDFDPPSKLLQNAFSYIHEENEASIDCIYLEENGVEVEIRQVHS